ncbi:MAG: DUF1080 domain-containing protein [Planctomycetaceae bacterium]|jgi:hypothetical protein|nr:DUF1080 domain-containing protein [Planctomycetaceae bacterium]
MKNTAFLLSFAVPFIFTAVFSADDADAGLFKKQPRREVGKAVPLIAKDSLDGWTNNAGKAPGTGWNVENGVLHLKGKGGDLITEKQYQNFILDFSWKIAKGGNSGIKYRYKKFDDKGWLGLEFQVLDDFNTQEGKKAKNSTATLYDILPVDGEKQLNPNDQLNHGQVIVLGNRIQHFLNGKKTVDVIVGSPEWKNGITASKFKDIKGFGENPLGYIHVQDHGSEVWFQDITIQEITPKKGLLHKKAEGVFHNLRQYKGFSQRRISLQKRIIR